jgi:small subunit ribosomal protein S17
MNEKRVTMTELTKSERTLQGKVVSDQRDKTITVLVETQKRHPVYEKIMKRHRKFHVHDEKNLGKIGDVVLIASCRPISKTKHWRLLNVIKSAV